MDLTIRSWDIFFNRKAGKEVMFSIFFVVTALLCGKLNGYSMFLSSTLLCILIGMLMGNTLLKGTYAPISQRFFGRICLDIGVILLGAKLNIIEILGFGKSIIFFVIFIGFTNVIVTTVIGRLLGLSKTQSVILGVGGMSCIVPAGDAVGAQQDEIGVAVGAVNFSETMFLFILPTVIASLKLTNMESAGIFTSAFHIMGYLVASATSVSEEVLKYTVVIKMARLLTFAPIVIALGAIFKKKSNIEVKERSKTKVPFFIKGFILISLILTGFQWNFPENQMVIETIKLSGKMSSLLINMAMVAIGLKIDIKTLLKKAPKAIICVALTAVLQMGIAFGISKVLF